MLQKTDKNGTVGWHVNSDEGARLHESSRRWAGCKEIHALWKPRPGIKTGEPSCRTKEIQAIAKERISDHASDVRMQMIALAEVSAAFMRVIQRILICFLLFFLSQYLRHVNLPSQPPHTLWVATNCTMVFVNTMFKNVQKWRAHMWFSSFMTRTAASLKHRLDRPYIPGKEECDRTWEILPSAFLVASNSLTLFPTSTKLEPYDFG